MIKLWSPYPNTSKYELRSRPHSRQLSQRTSRLTDCNFIVRLLYRDMYWLIIIHTWLALCLCLVLKYVLSFHLLNYWLIDWLHANFITLVGVICALRSLDNYMCHVQRQTTVTTVLPSSVLLCGTPYQLNCVWTVCVSETAEIISDDINMQQLTWCTCCTYSNLHHINDNNHTLQNSSVTTVTLCVTYFCDITAAAAAWQKLHIAADILLLLLLWRHRQAVTEWSDVTACNNNNNAATTVYLVHHDSMVGSMLSTSQEPCHCHGRDTPLKPEHKTAHAIT